MGAVLRCPKCKWGSRVVFLKKTQDIIKLIEEEGHTVMNWKPGNKRIFKVLDKNNFEASEGMYSNELRAWWRGYIRGVCTTR